MKQDLVDFLLLMPQQLYERLGMPAPASCSECASTAPVEASFNYDLVSSIHSLFYAPCCCRFLLPLQHSLLRALAPPHQPACRAGVVPAASVSQSASVQERPSWLLQQS